MRDVQVSPQRLSAVKPLDSFVRTANVPQDQQQSDRWAIIESILLGLQLRG